MPAVLAPVSAVDIALPAVVWYPALSAQTWGSLSPAGSAATFTPAASIGVALARPGESMAELVSPLAAWKAAAVAELPVLAPAPAAVQDSRTAASPSASADKPVPAKKTEEKRTSASESNAKTSEKTAEKSSAKTQAPSNAKTTVSAKKETSASAYKDPVPSPAVLHSKELAAKSKASAKSVTLEESAGEAVLQPAPKASTVPNPAQAAPMLSKTILGTQGSIMEVQMDGHGWLFTNSGAESAIAVFMDKKSSAPGDVFRFRLTKTGLARLSFSHQDLQTGLAEELQVSLISQPKESGSLSDAGTVKPVLASMATAVPAPAGNFGDRDLASLSPAEKTSWAAELMNQGRSSEALKIFQGLLDSPDAQRDEVLFKMACLYQDEASVRDIRKAYGLFVSIQKDFPRSKYSLQAKEKARYLKRTFQID